MNGSTVKASGEVKNIQTPWKEYDSKNNTGHFVPIEMPTACVNQEITIEGRKDGNRTATVDDDRMLVQRIENLSGNKMPVKMDGKTLMTVDFTGVIPTGKNAIDPDKKDFGGYGKMEDYVENISITWNGVKGKVTGTIKHHEAVGTKQVKEGWHYPLGMAEYYDGVAKDVTVSTKKSIKDKDIICDVSTAKTIKVEYNGNTVLELDLSGANFAEKG